MLGYFINKWIMARRFQKADSGYIYRRRPDLPGIMLTEAERRETLREYRRRYWRFWLAFFVILIAIVLPFSAFAVAVELDEKFITMAGYGLAVVMLIFVFKEQREWSLLPEKRFADRPRVAPELPTGGWLVRNQNLAERRSWPVHIGLIGIYGLALWFLTPRSLDASILQWFFFACFGFGSLALIHGAVCKARLSK